MSYNDYVKLVSRAPENWRIGQRLFNCLHIMDPIMADDIRGSSSDPYHASDRHDTRITAFFDQLKNRTNEQSYDTHSFYRDLDRLLEHSQNVQAQGTKRDKKRISTKE